MNVELGRDEVIASAPPDSGEIPPARRQRVMAWAKRRRRSLIGWAVLIVLFVMATVTRGLPLSEDTVLIWLLAALFVADIDDLRHWRRGVLRDWLPLYAVLAFYALMRGYASHVLWGPFITPQLDFDRFIGFGTIPTVWLQKALFDRHHLHVWDYAAWAVYTSHFFASYTIASVLWKRNHEKFKRFIALFVGLTFAGYLGYLLYPALPPWLARKAGRGWYKLHPAAAVPVYMKKPTGYHGATVRIIPVVWNHLGIHGAAALFTHGSAFDNDIASMPSLHAAYTMLILLFFWGGARWWLRVILAAYVLAMAFTLVYTGEHFVIDELFGWLFAAVIYFAGSWLLDRRAARRGLSSPPADLPGPQASQEPQNIPA